MSAQPQDFLLFAGRCEGCPGAQPLAGSTCRVAQVLHKTKALCWSVVLLPNLSEEEASFPERTERQKLLLLILSLLMPLPCLLVPIQTGGCLANLS